MATHPDREVERQLRDDLRITEDSHSPRKLKVMGKGSNPAMSTSEITSVSGDLLYRY